MELDSDSIARLAFDPESTRRVLPGIYYVWTRMDYWEYQRMDYWEEEWVDTVLLRQALDCSRDMVGTLSVVARRDSEVVFSNEVDPVFVDWTSPPPDTWENVLLKAVCPGRQP